MPELNCIVASYETEEGIPVVIFLEDGQKIVASGFEKIGDNQVRTLGFYLRIEDGREELASLLAARKESV